MFNQNTNIIFAGSPNIATTKSKLVCAIAQNPFEKSKDITTYDVFSYNKSYNKYPNLRFHDYYSEGTLPADSNGNDIDIHAFVYCFDTQQQNTETVKKEFSSWYELICKKYPNLEQRPKISVIGMNWQNSDAAATQQYCDEITSVISQIAPNQQIPLQLSPVSANSKLNEHLAGLHEISLTLEKTLQLPTPLVQPKTTKELLERLKRNCLLPFNELVTEVEQRTSPKERFSLSRRLLGRDKFYYTDAELEKIAAYKKLFLTTIQQFIRTQKDADLPNIEASINQLLQENTHNQQTAKEFLQFNRTCYSPFMRQKTHTETTMDKLFTESCGCWPSRKAKVK